MNRSNRKALAAGRLWFGAVLLSAVLAQSGRAGEAVAVVVNSNLKPLIQTALGRYVADMQGAGYAVTVRSWSLAAESTPEELKAYLRGIAGLGGAVFIGDLPIKWFETGNDHSTYGYATWPCDLYYMDLGSAWSDTDANGVLDTVSPDPAPEIWVSRIKASNMARCFPGLTEADLVSRYLDKNHAFRTGALRVEDRAMTYIDDDWSGWTDCGLAQVYGSVTVVNDRTTTTAVDYMSRWSAGYEHLLVCAHANSQGCVFRSGSAGSVTNTQIAAGEPRVLFWNLFNCSAARFTDGNYLAGAYTLGPDSGLLAVGSTKTGSMLGFSNYYSPISRQQSHGEAFRSWFRNTGCFFSAYNVSWYYGMSMFGDGTLKLGRFMGGATNTAPTISPILDQATDQDVPRIVSFTVGDAETPAESLRLAGYTPDNPDLVPPGAIVFGGAGASRTVRIAPAAGKSGTATVVVQAADGGHMTTATAFTLFVKPANRAPVAVDQGVTVARNTAHSIVLSATDADGDALSYAVLSEPAHGTLSGTAPNLVYAPAPDYLGTDGFTFRASDGRLDSNVAEVSISVLPAGNGTGLRAEYYDNMDLTGTKITRVDGPVDFDWGTGSPDASIGADTFSARWTGQVEAQCTETYTFHTITDDGVRLWVDGRLLVDSWVDQSATEHSGSIALAAGRKYDIKMEYYENGVDAVARLWWSSASTFKQPVPRSQLYPAGGNHSPVISSFSPADPVTVPAGTTQAFSVHSWDPDGDELSYVWKLDGSTAPANGDLMVYSPIAADAGQHAVVVTISDGKGGIVSRAWSVTVTEVNRPPVAKPQSVTTAEDTARAIVLTGCDPDGDALTFTVVTGPGHGTLSGTAPNVTYAPAADYNGPDGFTFKVSDGRTCSPVATVSITVTAVNDAPVAEPQSVSVKKNTPKAIVLTAADADGDALTFTVMTGPGHGTLSGTAPNVTYAPAVNYSGADSFTFKVSDGRTCSPVATVSIAVSKKAPGSADSGGDAGCSLAAAPVSAGGALGWLAPYLAVAALYSLSRRARRRSRA